jgi:hypothetical protein
MKDVKYEYINISNEPLNFVIEGMAKTADQDELRL